MIFQENTYKIPKDCLV